jgi:hypothetical protein
VQNGVQGHVVFKFKLKRLEDQPSLTTTEVHLNKLRGFCYALLHYFLDYFSEMVHVCLLDHVDC